jgi:hypothetical protein
MDISSDSVDDSISCVNEFVKMTVNGKTYELDCSSAEAARSWYDTFVDVCTK